MIQLPPSPPLDPWASPDEETEPKHSTQAGPSRSGPRPRTLRTLQPEHPLHTADLLSTEDSHALNGHWNGDVLGDVSRPALTRLTSETERQVAESSRSGSERGSLDLLRMSTANASTGGEEVEVLIHKVKPDESMVGIALLYGIDVATLRKINKLWASDPVHLRTHLYVPLEACKWTKARDTFTRGPGEGQVTLIPKNVNGKSKGKRKQDDNAKLVDIDNDTGGHDKAEGYDAWEDSARDFMPSTNLNYGRPSLDAGRMSLEADRDGGDQDEEKQGPAIRILDIVRIPRSQLQFFPKHKPPDPRKSLDSPLRTITHSSRRASDQADGPSIQNDLSTLPSPLQPRVPTPSKGSTSKMVRLRPPTAITQKSYTGPDTLVNRISSLFTVPPPPSNDLFGSRRTSGASANRSMPGSGTTSPARSAGLQDVSLELRPRSSFEALPKRNGHRRTASASKKYD